MRYPVGSRHKTHMRIHLLAILMTLAGQWASAQQYTSAKDSDPEALKLLQEAGKPFTAGPSQVPFTMKTTYPGEAPVTVSGTIYQSGKSFHIDAKDYKIISDGITRWVYMRGPNEVNVYNATQGADGIGPQELLTLYKAQDLVFVSMGARNDGTTVVEAKPLKGRFDEFTKFSIHLKGGKLTYILALAKDGTRTEINVGTATFPASLDRKLFTFDPAAYPGVHVEDLRLD